VIGDAHVYPIEPADAWAALVNTRWQHVAEGADMYPKFDYSRVGGALKDDSIAGAAAYVRERDLGA
jgi:hypothetical protein